MDTNTPFMMLKETFIQAPILHYPDPTRRYIVYTDASDLMHAEHNYHRNMMELKFPITSLSHIFTETQRKWSTPDQEAYGMYYAITNWNYYLQGADIIVHNNHKPLAKFLNGKNANNRWGLELVTYRSHLSGYEEHETKLLTVSGLAKLPTNSKTTIKILTATNSDGPAFNTRSETSHHHQTTTEQNLQILNPSRKLICWT